MCILEFIQIVSPLIKCSAVSVLTPSASNPVGRGTCLVLFFSELPGLEGGLSESSANQIVR